MENEEMMNDEDTRDLLASLEQCREMTQSSIMHCLDEGGDFVKKDHIKVLMDCTEISSMAVNFLIRDSEYAGDILNICAFICEDCAESCREFFNDKDMIDCAEVCDNCAEACRNMTTEELEEMEEETDGESDDENEK